MGLLPFIFQLLERDLDPDHKKAGDQKCISLLSSACSRQQVTERKGGSLNVRSPLWAS